LKISDIEAALNDAKNKALAALEIPPEVASDIALADSPNPEMGDVGFPCFALAKHLRKAPPLIAKEVAEQISPGGLIAEVVLAGPYVNFRLDGDAIAEVVVGQALSEGVAFGAGFIEEAEKWMVEFSAPNTNKPQHLGHVRNDLLGATVASILDFAGHEVIRANLINDRGIHICKSMLAYKKWGDGETPESSGEKGDHLVGKYYVMYGQKFKEEYATWASSDAADAAFAQWKRLQSPKDVAQKADDELRSDFLSGHEDTYFNRGSILGAETKKMLLDWEAGEQTVVELWELMNSWVFAGFDETYESLGVQFDRVYRESETYLLGKDIVTNALAGGKLEALDDGAVVFDLDKIGMEGQKVLLRSDGTSVYMTQDLGTAMSRFDEYDLDRMVYVVGNEQDYHFNVLFGVLDTLREGLGERLFHLSYGMVNLPEGKMKTREGTVVDADDLVAEMVALASEETQARYVEAGLSDDELQRRARSIGLAALKYYILDYNPRTTVQFDPKKSIDFQGRTGPYLLYSYARINSIAREADGFPELSGEDLSTALRALGTDLEMAVVKELQDWPRMVALAARQLDPSKVTEQLFRIAKAFSTMYNDRANHKIIEVPSPRKEGMLLLSKAVSNALATGFSLLGIEPLEEM
jgi:arginyl-tRNA synthetase